KFRAIRLPNSLEILLISDENLTTSFSREKKAACSLCVDVGNFSDPPEFPGISYFLAFEYMFFRKLEEQCITLENFIHDHDGTTHVSVENEHTIYYFNIKENNLLLALHKFGLFFINPIMPKHIFMEQLDAIKNQFQVSLFNGKSRYEQLFSSFAQIGHPANMFSVDHLIKLRNNIDCDKLYKMLDRFKKRHYSAHRMKLAIRSRLSLDTMEKFVKAYFARIPNNLMPPDNFFKFKNDFPFDTPAFRKMYKVHDDTEHVTRLQITWALPSFSDFYKCNSYQYISWSIGYKGKGSLISYLRKKMWSPTSDNSMFNCESQQNSLYSLIQLTIALTSKGRKHLEDVLDAIFSFINLLKTAGPQKEIYNDFCKIRQNTFRYINYDKEDISEVELFCKNMHFYPPKAYITVNQLDSNYNAKVIQKYLNYLAPEMANIMIFSKDFNCFELKKVEPWWQTAYTDIEIPKVWIERWKVIEPLPEFHLPSSNIFLINNFHLLKTTSNEKIEKYPVKLYNNSISELWYHPDFKFCLPKCCMHFYFISPLKLQSLKNGVLMDMYCKLLEQLLAEELYPALQVGFKYDISVNRNGFTLKIRGFNETLPLLAVFFAHGMVQYSSLITKDIFESTKIQQIQTYYDSVRTSKIFISDMALSILKLVHHSLIDMHTALQNITLKDFQDFVKSFTNCLYIQCLVQGNITPATAIKTVQQFIKIINCKPLHPDTIQQFKGTRIPLGISYYKIKNINRLDAISMISNYYQIDVTTIELSTLINLISYIMTHKLHEGLRTDKFIYITVDVRDIDEILGYSITVCIHADKCTTEYVDKKIDDFLRWFKNDLEKLTEEELDLYKEMFLKSRSHDDANLEEEVERNWKVIVKRTYIFDFHEQEILALKKINVNKLREWLADHISNESNFRKLSLHIVASIPKKAKYVHLEYINDDLQQYKPNKNHYITKVKDYKKNLFMFPTKCSNKSSQSTEYVTHINDLIV
ncbi:Nardilysin, partial [Atta colombica]